MLVISVLVITIAIWCNDELRSHSGCLPRASSSPPDSRAVGNDSGAGHGCARRCGRRRAKSRRSAGRASVDCPGALGGREPPRETWRSAAVLAETPRIYDAEDHARVARRKVASASVLPSPLPDACRRARFRQAMRAYREEHGGVTVLGELASPGTLFGAARVATERTRVLRSQRSGTPNAALDPLDPEQLRELYAARARSSATAKPPKDSTIQSATVLPTA